MGNTMDMKLYYEYRKELHKLYDHDTNNHGDLCSGILELRDKNKCIESIDLDISGYSISIEFVNDTPEAKMQSIINKCTNVIMNHIKENLDIIGNIANTEDFDIFLYHPNTIFCDIMVLKNTVIINL